jgi:uncharacterized glyoxalase superfamily protein PhnB
MTDAARTQTESAPVATPYLCVRDTAEAIEFYRRAFGATEVMRLVEPSGRIGYAQITIGRSAIMLADEFPEIGVLSPQSLGGTSVSIDLLVDDADAVVARAVAAGATVQRPVADQFYGVRSGTVVDPFGHRWLIGARIEAVTPGEMQRRYAALPRG